MKRRRMILGFPFVPWFAALVLLLLAGTAQMHWTGHVYAQSRNSVAAKELQAAIRGKIAPDLVETFQQAPNQPKPFLVYLKSKADLQKAFGLTDWGTRGHFVHETLKNRAQVSQRELLGHLKSQTDAGRVKSFKPYFIVNAIKVEAGQNVLEELAAREDVERIEAIKVFPVPKPLVAPQRETAGVEWGVTKIRAPELWNEGISGSGVVVANIDTGVEYNHGALLQQYRGSATGSHDYNWFDPTGTYSFNPGDNNGHGTHTMGTMVGTDRGSNQIGVAPSAQWIACKGCSDSSCAGDTLLACAEWILAPTDLSGNNADPSKRPNVVNNSWGGDAYCDQWYLSAVQAWRAAGIFPAFSAGNSGPAGTTIGEPGNYRESFATGATDASDLIGSFSSRGPSTCTDAGTKPDITAPGVSVRSSIPGGYASWNGTSMASPHTAGCVALLLSAFPGTSIEQLEGRLISSAVDLGQAGPDYTFGNGRLDCYTAVHETREQGQIVPDPLFFDVTVSRGEVHGEQLFLNNVGGADARFLITEVDQGTAFTSGKTAGTGKWLSRATETVRQASNKGDGEARPATYSWQPANPKSAAPSILIYADDPYHGSPSTFLDLALQKMGLAYTAVYNSDFVAFEQALAQGGWDLVLFGGDNYAPPETTLSALYSYVSSGGRLIYSSWSMSAYSSHALFTALGISFPQYDYAGIPVYWWDSANPLFNRPETVPQFTSLQTGRFGTYGQYVSPLAGFSAVAGYSTSAAEGMATLVVNDNGKTIFKGFMDGHNDADLDSDSAYDGAELWLNMIAYLLGGAPSTDVPWLSEEPASGTISSRTSLGVGLTFDATELEPATYRARLVVSSDTGQAPLEIPVTMTVTEAGSRPHLDLENTLAMKDSVARIPIRLTNVEGVEIAATSNDIYFDSSLFEVVDAEIGPAGSAAAKSVTWSVPEDGVLRLGVLGINNNPIGDGIVAYALIYVYPEVEPWEYSLYNLPSASDIYGNDVPVYGNSAILTVVSLFGDCDGNGIVSIGEVQSAINMFLELNPVESCSDPDGNGSVTIDEVQLIVNNYLGISGSSRAAIAGAGKPSVLSLRSANGKRGQSITVPIRLSKKGGQIAALSTDIAFDPSVIENPTITVGPAARKAKKELAFNLLADGVLRMGLFGMNDTEIPNGIVAYLNFTIKEQAPKGTTYLTHAPAASDPQGHMSPIKPAAKRSVVYKLTVK